MPKRVSDDRSGNSGACISNDCGYDEAGWQSVILQKRDQGQADQAENLNSDKESGVPENRWVPLEAFQPGQQSDDSKDDE